MIPDRDALDALAYAHRGDLAQTPFPALLIAYASNQRSVELEVKKGPVTKLITFADGTPIDCQSNLLQDTIGRFLVTRGEISEEQWKECHQESLRAQRPIDELLAERGLLTSEVLAKTQQQHLARKLLDAFAWQTGSFRSTSLSRPPESTLKLKVPQLVVMGIGKLTPAGQIIEAMGPLLDGRLFLDPAPIFGLDELRLSASQKAVVEGLRVGKRITDLASTPEDTDRVTRFLFALAILGVVVEHEPKPIPVPARSAPPPVARAMSDAELSRMPTAPFPPPVPPAAAAQTPTPMIPVAAPAPVDRNRRRDVLDLHARLRELDAFDLLGVAPDAGLEVLQAGFLAYSEKVAPWTLRETGEAGDLEGKARELFLAGGNAFAELMDPERRNSLRARRSSVIDRQQDKLKSARDAFRIQTALLDPGEQFAKGVALIARKRYTEALEQLQYAVDCDPQNAIYRAELARCHFLSQPASRARESVRDLEEATRLDPECGIAFFYLGEIQAGLGRMNEAQVALKRAARLMLPDRRPLELLKSLEQQSKKGKGIGKWLQ